MSGKNKHHVAVYPSKETLYWAFVVPSNATTCSEQTAEMTKLCEALFETFTDFVIPVELSFHIHRFPAGQELPASINDSERIDTLERKLENEDGISVGEFLDATQVSGSNSLWMPIVEFERLKVNVHLERGSVYADRENHCVEYRAGEPLDRTPMWDPLRLSLAHYPNRDYETIDTDFVTSVTVAPKTDLWFEDTEIGRRNARQLASFFERIEQAVPVELVKRTSDWLPVEELESIY